jgi:hypothetical protein
MKWQVRVPRASRSLSPILEVLMNGDSGVAILPFPGAYFPIIRMNSTSHQTTRVTYDCAVERTLLASAGATGPGRALYGASMKLRPEFPESWVAFSEDGPMTGDTFRLPALWTASSDALPARCHQLPAMSSVATD